MRRATGRGRWTISPSARNSDAVGDRRGVRVVRDHHDRLAELVDRLAQQRQHLLAGARVEVAGRLVGEQDGRARDERAGDGDALLLAAGELGRAVRAPVARGRPCRAAPRPTPRSGFAPASESGSTMFSSAVSIGSRLKNWKMKPMWSRRSCVSAVSLEPGDVDAGDRDRRPRSGRSRPARMCISVDLPEPDGPMIAVSWPCAMSSETPRSASHGGVAVAVAAGDAGGGHDRGGRARSGASHAWRSFMRPPSQPRAPGELRAAPTSGCAASAPCEVGSQVGQHGQDAAVVVVGRRQVELGEDRRDVLLHGALGDPGAPRSPGSSGPRPSARAPRARARSARPAGRRARRPSSSGDDLRVQRGAAAGHAADRVGERRRRRRRGP